jgi:predicted site-specific integrase-resolvase
MSDILTSKELAERWSLNEQTIRVWRQRGKGPAFIKLSDHPQGEVRYRLEDVEAYEQSRKRNKGEKA